MKLDRPLILASQSPRRRQLLAALGFVFEIVPPKIDDEDAYLDFEALPESVQALAAAKADSVARCRPESLVLGSDTVVVLGEKVLGKAMDRDDAFLILRKLSGQTHRVISGVSLHCAASSFRRSISTTTIVTFRNLEECEIENYLDGGEYIDKAGAYGIQGTASVFVREIRGCYTNVVGLPVHDTIELFRDYTHFQRRGHD